MGEVIDANKKFDLVRRINNFEFEGQKGDLAVRVAYSQHGYFSDDLEDYSSICEMYFQLDPQDARDVIDIVENFYGIGDLYMIRNPTLRIRYKKAKDIEYNL